MLTSPSFRRVALSIALAVLLLPALALASTHNPTVAPVAHTTLWILTGLCGLAGTVVVTYNFQPQGTTTPVSSTVAPTAIQAQGFNSIACLVSMAESDTTATLTHNWNESANDNALYRPWLSWYTLTAGTALPFLSFAVTTNAVTLTKSNAAGTSGSFVVILRRPNSIVT